MRRMSQSWDRAGHCNSRRGKFVSFQLCHTGMGGVVLRDTQWRLKVCIFARSAVVLNSLEP